jgi:hypothetical protein
MSASRFAAQFARLDGLLEREILRLRARYSLTLDEFRGLYVSDEQVDRLVASAVHQFPASTGIHEHPSAGACSDARWSRIVETALLTPLDEDLLLIAAAPELDLKYETLYAYLNNDVTRKWPTMDLAQRVLAGIAEPNAVASALAPGGTLRARGIMRPIEPPSGRPSLLNGGFSLDPCVTHWLHFHSALAAFEGGIVQWPSGKLAATVSAATRARAEPIVRICNRPTSSADVGPVVALLGPAGSGRAEVAATVAAAIGHPLVRLDVRAFAPGEAALAETLDRLTLALALEPAVVLVEGFAAFPSDEHRRIRDEARIAAALDKWRVPVLLRTSDDEPWRACIGARRLVECRCELRTYRDRFDDWRDASRTAGGQLLDVDLGELAGRYMLTAGQIRAAFATAQDLATMEGASDTLTPEKVAAAARLASDQELGRLAIKVDRMHGWIDLVLPPTTVQRLHELTAAIRQRHIVFGDWGFGDRIVTGMGIKALFAGASGTGKTMAAGVIARELGLDLYKIDLSGVVSKYIGETEKNLDRIFRAARAANAIVFLDEAEAIMGKRSEVKDAHDRYANIEVAYLLQKLEEHEGIVILATNLKRNIDDAFSRRIQYVIDFPRPDEAERARIWRGMFPARSPLAADVDFEFLSKQFDFAGGDIRNIVLDAAFLAIQNGGEIGMKCVVEALARQLAKQGKAATASEFRQYQRLLPSGIGRRDAA